MIRSIPDMTADDRPMAGSRWSRTAGATVVAALAVTLIATFAFLSSVGAGVRLLNGTLIGIGGNTNAASFGMDQELGGDPYVAAGIPNPGVKVGRAGQSYLDPTNAASPYFGYTYRAVPWPSQIPFTTDWDGHTTFEQSQRQGVVNLRAAVDQALATGGPVTVASLSSSSNVVTRLLRELEAAGYPNADQLSFVTLGNLNRPNGGIAQRFPGLYVPIVGIPLDGSTPADLPYRTLDVSWQYDPISDFPNYPLNLVSTLNSILAFTLHTSYYPADLAGPRAVPDYTAGTVTYVTLAAPGRLPLLLPLQDIGIPKQFLDLVEPVLKVIVDLGYDRSIPANVPTTAGLGPSPQRLLAAPVDLLDAVGQGIYRATNPGWDAPPATGPATKLPAPTTEPTTVVTTQLRTANVQTSRASQPVDAVGTTTPDLDPVTLDVTPGTTSPQPTTTQQTATQQAATRPTTSRQTPPKLDGESHPPTTGVVPGTTPDTTSGTKPDTKPDAGPNTRKPDAAPNTKTDDKPDTKPAAKPAA